MNPTMKRNSSTNPTFVIRKTAHLNKRNKLKTFKEELKRYSKDFSIKIEIEHQVLLDCHQSMDIRFMILELVN